MHINDLVNQYNSNLAAGSKVPSGTKGVEQLVKTVSSMERGQIFEGTVNSIKGNKVTLGLSSGQSITAKLDKGVTLSPGQSVFFQVKSNEGGLIQIKPVFADYGSNLTLLNALEAAGLPKTENNLNMVNNMMQQQMPIDSKSVNDMSKLLLANPGTDVSTLVSMNKLGLPISPEMVQQFENYRASEGAILDTVNDMLSEMPKVMSEPNISAQDVIGFQKELVSILTEDVEIPNPESVMLKEEAVKTGAQTDIKANSSSELIQSPEGEPIEEVAKSPETVQREAAGRILSSPITYERAEFPSGTIGRALAPEENMRLSVLLTELPEVSKEAPHLFDSNGNLNPNASAAELARVVTDVLSNNPNIPKSELMKVFGNKSFSALLGNLMENKWTLEPKDILEKGKIDKLYEKINEDMERISKSASTFTKSTSNDISNTAQNIKNNLQFIQQVNEMVSYVQLPLRMAGQSTTGDLYVYTNKKSKKNEDDDTLSAFLHFDLDNLGSTDISVKMKNKDVDTKFFMEDDISFQIIKNNIHILEQKLNDLGYNCTIDVENDSKAVNLIEDFMKTDSKTAGNIQRYSFDVRA